MIRHVVACILAGGEGRRLFPHTARRAKPAVRFGGSYRLIDFPISNCVNSEIPKILTFSQYESLSLDRQVREGRRAIVERGTTVPPGTRIGYESAADRERFAVSPAGITVVAHAPALQGLEKGPMELPITIHPRSVQAGYLAITSV